MSGRLHVPVALSLRKEPLIATMGMREYQRRLGRFREKKHLVPPVAYPLYRLSYPAPLTNSANSKFRYSVITVIKSGFPKHRRQPQCLVFKDEKCDGKCPMISELVCSVTNTLETVLHLPTRYTT